MHRLPHRAALIGGLASEPTLEFGLIGGPEAALESLVQTLAMSFWQSTGAAVNCASLPDPDTAEPSALYFLLDDTIGIWSVSDAGLRFFAPYFILAHREEGYPALPTAQIEDLLTTGAPSAEEGVVPDGVPIVFDGTFSEHVDSWVASDAERIVFVRGEFDGWGVIVHPVSPAREVLSLEVSGAGHGAYIAGLDAEQRRSVIAAVERWIADAR